MPKARDDHQLSQQFGTFVFGLRDARGLSQRAAARLVGVSQARLASIEQGRHTNTGRPTLPSAELCERLATAYNCPRDLVLLLAGYAPWLLNEGEARRLLDAAVKALAED